MKEKKLSLFVFVLYCFLLSWLILFKFSTDFSELPQMRSLNLIPFAASAKINGAVNLSEIFYNVLVFVPLGVYISIFKKEWSPLLKILIAAGVSCAFEVIQYIGAFGASDITDLINNTLGAFAGILLFGLLKRMCGEKAVRVVNISGLSIELIAVAFIALLKLAN